MVKARPEASPHYRLPTWEKPSGLKPRRRSRRPMMTDAGNLDGQVDLDLLKPTQVVQLEPVEPRPEEPHRSFWFKKGTVLYSIDFPIPRSPIEEENRRAQVLEEAQPLQIDAENLVYSERLGRWTPRAKMEHKSKLYGAFVIANVHITARNGENETVRRFVSLKDLQKPKDNPLARFKEAVK